MNAGIILRQAVPEDLKDLQTLFVETINEVCRDDYNDDQRSVWTSAIKNEPRWLEKIKNQYFLVALLNDKVVGFGSLENGDYLDFMYIKKTTSARVLQKRYSDFLNNRRNSAILKF